MGNKFLIGNGNLSSDTIWSTTSGGANDTTHPTSADDVICDANSGAVTLTCDAGTSIKSINCTGFTGALANSANATCAGSMTLDASMSAFSPSTYKWTISATATVTSSGFSFYEFGTADSTYTITLSDAMAVTKLTLGAGATYSNVTFNGFSITVSGDITQNTYAGIRGSAGNEPKGTTTLTINGTGAQAFVGQGGAAVSGYRWFPFDITINKASGTLTFSNSPKLGGDLTFTAGDIDFGTSDLLFCGSNITYTSATITHGNNTWSFMSYTTKTVSVPSGFISDYGNFYNLSFKDTSNVYTLTLTWGADITVTNTTTFGEGSTYAQYVFNTNNLFLQGAIVQNNYSRISGTTDLTIDGSAVQTFTGHAAAGEFYTHISNDLTINKSGGSLTFSNEFSYKTGTLTFTSGSVSAGTGTLYLPGGSVTLATNGINWNKVEAGNGTTVTLTNAFTVAGEFVWNGTADTWNGQTVHLKGDFNTAQSFVHINGTTAWTIDGSGNQEIYLQAYGSTRYVYGAWSIASTGGTVTFHSSESRFAGGFTYTSGAVDLTTHTTKFTFSVNSQSISASGLTFYDLAFDTHLTTMTISTNLSVSHTTYLGNGGIASITLNGNTISTLNLDTNSNYNRTISGTTTFEFTGSAAGSWTSNTPANTPLLKISNSITINRTGSTLTVTNNPCLNGGTFSWQQGTVDWGTTTVVISGSIVLSLNGTTLYNLTWDATNTTTLSNQLDVSNLVKSSAATTLAGTGGIDTVGLTIDSTKSIVAGNNQINVSGNWTNNGTFTANTSTVVFDGTSTVAGATAFYSLTIAAGATVHLTAGQTFSTNASGTFTADGTSSTITLDSTSAGTRATLTVNGAQNVSHVDATDIDSSAGNTVNNSAGSASNCLNWEVAFLYTGNVTASFLPTSTYVQGFAFTGSVTAAFTPTGLYNPVFVAQISGGTVYFIIQNINVSQPRKFAIELRDKDLNLKARLEPFVTAVQWEWNRIGGCGRATLKVDGDYLRFKIQADDDIRIYLPNEDGLSSTLWYRGYVQSASPELSGGGQYISIECSGYFDWLDRIIVHDSGDFLTYASTDIISIVRDIIDTYIVANSDIARGTVDGGSFAPDSIQFKDDAKTCLRTLFDLLGDIEYGVDAQLNFFWRNQDQDVQHKFWLGDKVVKLSDRIDFRNIINQIYFEGGKVGSVPFTTSGGSASSQNRYGKHEAIISNGSITTLSVASKYISGVLYQKGRPGRQLSVALKNITKRFEETIPMGAVSIIDTDATQIAAIYGTTANGGSNKVYGTLANGGSGQLYGGHRKEQIDRVQYSIEPGNGRISAQVQFGDSLAVSRASATLKKIELVQNALRQRSL